MHDWVCAEWYRDTSVQGAITLARIVAYLMTPRNNGLGNMARFMTSIQDAVTGNGPNPLPLDRHGPLGHLIAEKQFKRNLSTRRTALEDQRQVAVEELALESRNFDKLAEAFRQGR
mmetsp:Transcript_8828/g.16199  ORF Transcript_8828/g.16199 Transcript_8828/m.16199 type:complete len:116 (-) Transcript_8828:1164-1511(-)